MREIIDNVANGYENITHYNVKTIRNALFDQAHEYELKNLAAIFDRGKDELPLSWRLESEIMTPEVAKSIENALLNMTPRKNQMLWKMLHNLTSRYDFRISEINYHMMVSFGLNPVIIFMSILSEQKIARYSVDSQEYINPAKTQKMHVMATADDEYNDEISIFIGCDKNTCYDDGKFIVGDIPQTILAMMKGKALNEVIYHPALASRNYTVTDLMPLDFGDPDDKDNLYKVMFDHSNEYLTIKEIAEKHIAEQNNDELSISR